MTVQIPAEVGIGVVSEFAKADITNTMKYSFFQYSFFQKDERTKEKRRKVSIGHLLN